MSGRALVVDDHPLFCEALSMTLQSATQLDDVQTAASLETALRLLDEHPAPDLILLDLNLPGIDGMDGLIRIKTAVPDVPVIVVSSMADDRIVASALHAGASGYVPKHSPRETFLDAVGEIERGGVYHPQGFIAVAGSAAQPQQSKQVDPNEAIDRIALLTKQQARILSLLCEGKLNKQIAFELDIAEATVKAHITAILRKLKVVSRTQAVVVAQNTQFSSILQNVADQS